MDHAVIERFLTLIRDNYPKADRASFFLEEVAGKTNVLVMANLRDVLSHLATTLSEETSPDEWGAQLASAEEHFRRAIQEPYAIALGNLRERFNSVHARYQKISPQIQKSKGRGLFATAPTPEVIQVQLRKIADLASEGRAAKRRNRIDSKWDDGVADCIEAFDKLELLTTQLSGYVHEYESIVESRRSKTWTIVGTVAGIVFAILSIALVVYPDFTLAVQKFVGVSVPPVGTIQQSPNAPTIQKSP